MSSSLVMLLTFVCAALLVVGVVLLIEDVFFRYRSAVRSRLADLSGNPKGAAGAIVIDLKQLAALTVTQNNWRSSLGNLLEQAGLSISLNMLLFVALGIGFVLALAAYSALGQSWVIPCCLTIGFAAPLTYIRARRASRIRRISRQLPDVFDTMARAVRAGQTVPAAFQLVADEFEPPISDEFWHCFEQQNLGIPFDSSVRELARRLPVMELRILVVALLVQSRSGGNLVSLLNNLSIMARKRIKMRQRLLALTGEARMQALVLIVLPILALAAVLILSPDYAAALLERPWLLGVTFASQLFGAIWIRRIVRTSEGRV